MSEITYTWVCQQCQCFRDYGADNFPSENPRALLKCEECKEVTWHQQVDSDGNPVDRAVGRLP